MLVTHLMRYYVPLTISYGVIRKSHELQHATIRTYDQDLRKNTRVPMLLTDKIALTVFGGVAAIYGWPVFLVNDLRKTEVTLRKLDPNFYDCQSSKDSLLAYILS